MAPFDPLEYVFVFEDAILSSLEFVTAIKDLCLGASAIAGAYVAITGLNTWKRQLKGHAEYELSRRILVGLYKHREALAAARYPAIWSHEMDPRPEDQARGMPPEKQRHVSESRVYQTRLDKVQAVRVSLEADLLESEALWGNELRQLFKVPFGLEAELVTNIRHHLQLMDPDAIEGVKRAIATKRRELRDIMYDGFNEDDDEFKRDFQRGAEQIEAYLRPKLHS